VCESVCVWVHTEEPQWTNNGQREIDGNREEESEAL